jgi:hypothetical protein
LNEPTKDQLIPVRYGTVTLFFAVADHEGGVEVRPIGDLTAAPSSHATVPALRYGVPTGDVIRIALGVLSVVTNEIDHGSALKVDRGDEVVEVTVRESLARCGRPNRGERAISVLSLWAIVATGESTEP